MTELELFLEEISLNLNTDTYQVDLMRWSVDEPYWLLIICVYNDLGVIAIKDHYHIDKSIDINDVYELLKVFGYRYTVRDYYFMKRVV